MCFQVQGRKRLPELRAWKRQTLLTEGTPRPLAPINSFLDLVRMPEHVPCPETDPRRIFVTLHPLMSCAWSFCAPIRSGKLPGRPYTYQAQDQSWQFFRPALKSRLANCRLTGPSSDIYTDRNGWTCCRIDHAMV